MKNKEKLVVLYSGGLDSTVLLKHLIKAGHEVHALVIQYGQKHDIELGYADTFLNENEIEFTNSDFDVHYYPPNDKAVVMADEMTVENPVVPGRNAIFLSAAAAYAVRLGYDAVVLGANKDDAELFPDCRKEFIAMMHQALTSAYGIGVAAPMIEMTKKEIWEYALQLGIDPAKTWSCYDPQPTNSKVWGTPKHKPCEKCLPCRQREEAKNNNGEANDQ